MTFHDSPTNIPDPEVVPKAKRRKFSVEYKRRILEEANDEAQLPACNPRSPVPPPRLQHSI